MSKQTTALLLRWQASRKRGMLLDLWSGSVFLAVRLAVGYLACLIANYILVVPMFFLSEHVMEYMLRYSFSIALVGQGILLLLGGLQLLRYGRKSTSYQPAFGGDSPRLFTRRGHSMAAGYMLDEIWDAVFFFYFRQTEALCNLWALAETWRHEPKELPPEVGACVEKLLAEEADGYWLPAAEYPQLLPHLDELLHREIVEVRTSAGAVEFALSSAFADYLRKHPAFG